MPLLIAATPLGNPADASARLIAAIASAQIIAAEDSRRFHRLASDLNVKFSATIISFFEGNEEERTGEVLSLLKEGKEVLLISDAGMPTISDPGFKLIRAAIGEGIALTVLPGPSAVTTAIALSGFPTDRFAFEGFAPRTSGAREKFYEELRFESRTTVFFEAPHRLVDSLATAEKVLGSDREICICRELTKQYEEIVRMSLGDAVKWSQSKEMLGEITIVLAGVEAIAQAKSEAEIVARVKSLEGVGMERKAAISAVADEMGIPKRLIFDAMVAAKSTESDLN
ncbi:MAG: 16S rRNA (cytidine(1402)-2'-O)-methyltransferase [Actinomycetes bacterium]